MLDELRSRYHALVARARRLERRELGELSAWLENTRNLLHLSVLLFLPLLIGLVTAIANAVDLLPFLLFPPLASGIYTLFANPEGRYASPRRFVGGMTTGALCGWLALELSARFWYEMPPSTFRVHAGAAAFGVLLTGLVTWALDIEEPTAFSTALLVLVAGVTQFVYVASVLVSTLLVAGVFVLWRREFYERRARYLYRSTKGDDHVLVPMRGDHPEATAMLAARLAAAHDAGKVVLLDVVDDEAVAEAERRLLEERGEHATPSGPADRGPEADDAGRDTATPDSADLTALAEERAADDAAERLEGQAARVESAADVPCEVVVAVGGSTPAATVLRTAREANCDLVTTPYEASDGRLSPFVRELFAGDVDVLVHRSVDGRAEWRNVLVAVRRAGDVAHAMIDFAARLAPDGQVSVCHCIEREDRRRAAESMLANLAETASVGVETRVARSAIAEFLAATAPRYDLVIVGASTDRSAASRFLSPPTFRQLRDIDCDVAILHRGRTW